ncbi:MAG TPA: DegT/DnrJ/EryC1/StrS family aminotransferase [Candidatus Dormibacteraeota bacterium]|nr:DegT/DnrJ/EryC1/StrS family aminotransferase [Candidatus Dormibacteraeota bacterium]
MSGSGPGDRQVPFRDLARLVDDPEFAWREALVAAVERAGFGRPSPATADVERALARCCGTSDAVATASGSAALLLAMLGLGIGPGDEVVTVANTFAATVAAIVLLGATPVLVDVDRRSYTMDPDAFEAAITPRTRLVVPVHLFGRLADMAAIGHVAGTHGITVLEEACQAFGACRDGRMAGAFGDLAVFSFGPTKPVTGLGEGGAIVTSDAALAERLRLLNDHGKAGDDHRVVGLNFKMHPLEAAVLAERLRQPERWLRERRAIAAAYNRALGPLGCVHNPLAPTLDEHSYYVYVVEADDRAHCAAHLARHGVATDVHYPRPVHRQTAYAGRVRYTDLAVTEAVGAKILSLPLINGLTGAEVAHVADVTGRYFADANG